MKNILFDVDGTIFDTSEGVGKSVLYAMDKLGEKKLEDEILIKFIGPPLLDGFMQFAGLSYEKSEKAVEYYREYYNPEGVYMASPYNGIAGLLKDLERAGKNMYIVSSKPTVFVEKLLKKYGLHKYFKDIAEVRFDNCHMTKAELIGGIMEKHGMSKADTVMIGDRCFDIEGAKNTGIKAIGAAYGFGSRGELLSCGADFIAENPEEIKKFVL